MAKSGGLGKDEQGVGLMVEDNVGILSILYPYC